MLRLQGVGLAFCASPNTSTCATNARGYVNLDDARDISNTPSRYRAAPSSSCWIEISRRSHGHKRMNEAPSTKRKCRSSPAIRSMDVWRVRFPTTAAEYLGLSRKKVGGI